MSNINIYSTYSVRDVCVHPSEGFNSPDVFVLYTRIIMDNYTIHAFYTKVAFVNIN